MERLRGRHLLVALLVGGAGGWAGCSSDGADGSTSSAVVPGAPCSTADVEASAPDDCNTCTCERGTWVCTRLDCGQGGAAGTGGASPGATGGGGGVLPPGAECFSGEGRTEGCNVCLCEEGLWACTEEICPVDWCNQGARFPNDACNLCVCNDHAWSCTDYECDATCLDGATRPADDECNSCRCANGAWVCTELPCEDGPCFDGDRLNVFVGEYLCQGGRWGGYYPYAGRPPGCAPQAYEPSPDCPDGEVFARSVDAACCSFSNVCAVPDGFTMEDSQLECFGWRRACGDGDAAEYADTTGCYRCACDDEGSWLCVAVPCEAPCTPGETRLAAEGCDRCTCEADGSWTCLPFECTPPCGGAYGDTCLDSEYCDRAGAYLETCSETGYCQQRPVLCSSEGTPYCGCDGATHTDRCDVAEIGGAPYDRPCGTPREQ